MFSPELWWIQAGTDVRVKGKRGNEVKVMSSIWFWARPLSEPRPGFCALEKWVEEAGTREEKRSPNARGRRESSRLLRGEGRRLSVTGGGLQ